MKKYRNTGRTSFNLNRKDKGKFVSCEPGDIFKGKELALKDLNRYLELGRVRPLLDTDTDDLITQSDYDKEIKRLNDMRVRKVAELNVKITEVREESAKKIKELNIVHEEEVSALEEEVSALKKQLPALEEKNEDLLTKCKELEDEVVVLREKLVEAEKPNKKGGK